MVEFCWRENGVQLLSRVVGAQRGRSSGPARRCSLQALALSLSLSLSLSLALLLSASRVPGFPELLQRVSERPAAAAGRRASRVAAWPAILAMGA